MYVEDVEDVKDRSNTGRVPLIQTRLIRSFTLFEVSVKCFPIIFLSFHVKNARLIRSST